jgi:hypothetical protein
MNNKIVYKFCYLLGLAMISIDSGSKVKSLDDYITSFFVYQAISTLRRQKNKIDSPY